MLNAVECWGGTYLNLDDIDKSVYASLMLASRTTRHKLDEDLLESEMFIPFSVIGSLAGPRFSAKKRDILNISLAPQATDDDGTS